MMWKYVSRHRYPQAPSHCSLHDGDIEMRGRNIRMFRPGIPARR
jgi:hypothetical protein